VEVMLSITKGETVALREQKTRGTLLRYVVVLTLAGFILVTIWLLVFAWRRETDIFDFERASSAVASYPMQLSPLIAGNDKATVGELVYLTHVLLKPGPTAKVFFVAGSKGMQILTVAQSAHVLAMPGEMVDVRGTIRNTPAIGILRKQWKLSVAEAKRVSQIPIYIESSFIRESDD
jgi:hypothetical protein